MYKTTTIDRKMRNNGIDVATLYDSKMTEVVCGPAYKQDRAAGEETSTRILGHRQDELSRAGGACLIPTPMRHLPRRRDPYKQTAEGDVEESEGDSPGERAQADHGPPPTR